VNVIEYIGNMEKAYSDLRNLLREEYGRCDIFNNYDAIIPRGIYKGRWGKIESARFSQGEIVAMIRPYSLRVYEKGKLLWDRADARTFWNLNEVKKFRLTNEKTRIH